MTQLNVEQVNAVVEQDVDAGPFLHANWGGGRGSPGCTAWPPTQLAHTKTWQSRLIEMKSF